MSGFNPLMQALGDARVTTPLSEPRQIDFGTDGDIWRLTSAVDDCDESQLTNRSLGENGEDSVVGQIRLQGQLHDMDTTLIEKEKLLNELVKNQRDFDHMRNTYERKMEDMQRDIRQIEEERDKVGCMHTQA